MITDERRVATEIKAYFKTAVETVEERRLSRMPKAAQAEYRRRADELHPSSFPYCGYRHAYQKLVEDPDPVVFLNFGSSYYTGLGTVFHSIAQEWMSRGGQVIGDYVCQKCKHVHAATLRPKVCGHQGCKSRRFDYEEIGGVWGKHIHWHADGVFVDKKGRYWIIDYKTSSTSAISRHIQQGAVFPYLSNKAQIESYTVLMEKKLKQKIHGWILFYVARDFPSYTHTPVVKAISDERRDEVRARLKRNDADFGKVLGLKDAKLSVKKQTVTELRETKLCDCKATYTQQVYDKYNPCPVADYCFSSKKAEAVFANAFKGIPIEVRD